MPYRNGPLLWMTRPHIGGYIWRGNARLSSAKVGGALKQRRRCRPIFDKAQDASRAALAAQDQDCRSRYPIVLLATFAG